MRIALMLGIAGCAHAAAPAPTPAPTPIANPPPDVAEPVAEVALDSKWQSCLISKKELEDDIHDKVTIAPDGGYVLGLRLVERSGGNMQKYQTWIGLPAVPVASSKTTVSAMLSDDMVEMEGGVSTRYEIHGDMMTSADGGSVTLTLASTQQPHMFDPGSPLHEFTVKLRTIHHLDDCK